MDAEAYITNFYEGRDYLQLSEETKQVHVTRQVAA
jgi:hypothetical protein